MKELEPQAVFLSTGRWQDLLKRVFDKRSIGDLYATLMASGFTKTMADPLEPKDIKKIKE